MRYFNFSAIFAVTTVYGCLMMVSPSAYATDYVWSGTTTGKASDWFNAKNWKKRGARKIAANTLSAAFIETASPATTAPGAGDTATITDGATVAIERPVTLAALTVEDNSTVVGSGDITVTSSLTLQDANLSGAGDVNIPSDATATLSSQESATSTGNIINKVIDNSGVINWTSGDLTLQKDFHNSGDFNIKTDDDIKMSGMVVATLYNEGTLTKSDTASDSNIDVALKNSGDIYLRSGSLDVGPNFVQSDGSLNLDGGNVGSPGTLQVDGGVVKGTGLIDCSVNQNGGTFKPGHSPGIITINGNYTQASTAFLDMEIGGQAPGTGYDQMNIWGKADMNGTLDIIRYNNYLPQDGDNIELLRYYDVGMAFKNVTGKYPGGSIYYVVVKSSTSFFACAISDTTDPAVKLTSPVSSLTYQGVASVKGTCADAEEYASGVKSLTVRFYRYASGSIPAGYWLGGSSWSTTWSPANELVPVGVANWTLTLPTLPPAKYLTRATATDNVGNSVMTPNVIFIISSTTGTFVKAPEKPSRKLALISLEQPRKFFVSSRS